MANIIPSGNTAANSADIPVVAGTPVTFHGFAADGVKWTAQIKIKDSGGGYTTVGAITDLQPAQTVYGPGTYRVARPAGGGVCGIDQD